MGASWRLRPPADWETACGSRALVRRATVILSTGARPPGTRVQGLAGVRTERSAEAGEHGESGNEHEEFHSVDDGSRAT
jgi:hypothetical protein